MEIICHIKWKPFKNFKQLRYKMSFQLVFRSFLTFYKLIISCSCCSVAKSCLTLCDPMNCSTPGFPVLHYLQEFVHTHVYWVGDAIQPSHPLPPPPFVFSLSQHQGLFFPSESHLRIGWPEFDIYPPTTPAWSSVEDDIEDDTNFPQAKNLKWTSG